MKYKYKVLIADADEKILSTLKNHLEQQNYEVEVTQSAKNAFEKVKSDKYHIALIDIDLPEMSGIELLREIKSFDALIQVIMMAENSTMDKILNALEYGANDYIQKTLSDVEYITQIINYSVEKLERWRKSIIQIIK
ncbi:response regulator transcription factor [Defluviitalea raffinosedens]|jgi:DNA-binding response OmpR family regulator|uniref:Stage 0 sporulation protein A homolog n=1 Tax=Defluviitalea raffinosedens TaxID=1450156 RepID=A0A7C8HDI2_9FIRM|nr:response regulator [Defluviitalea raffinosedens]KAE9631213.1 response regulator [Defluviitalea raffinosedens]MBM7686258.1 DNA-binding response OmpR family regulator [Defluviitalea raffinosedens]MBZ4669025.1 response regulator [Defluviitaleaceae bacterium]HHW68599.1 response regulator [Candidatus Epulonipiscium sp.]